MLDVFLDGAFFWFVSISGVGFFFGFDDEASLGFPWWGDFCGHGFSSMMRGLGGLKKLGFWIIVV